MDLYGELADMLEHYRAVTSDDDAALLDEVGHELRDSLDRVSSNGGRVLSIVERMRGLGVVGGEPQPADLNAALRLAAQAACTSFETEWGDFTVRLVMELDGSLGPVPLVTNDFGEAVKNLVSNSCFAMRLKQNATDQLAPGQPYEPTLLLSPQRVNGMVEIRFRDNGTGIDEEVVEKIFNPLFSTRDGILGAGLGLAIAGDVVRRTGGSLSVDTASGEYAEFLMSLPAGSSTSVG